MEENKNIQLKRKEDQELKLYFFVSEKIISAIGQPAIVEKKITYVTAFKLEDAFDLARAKDTPTNLFFTNQSIKVMDFLSELGLEHLKVKTISKIKQKIEPVMSFDKFRTGLLFFANEETIIYNNLRDKKALKRIISGLSYKNV